MVVELVGEEWEGFGEFECATEISGYELVLEVLFGWGSRSLPNHIHRRKSWSFQLLVGTVSNLNYVVLIWKISNNKYDYLGIDIMNMFCRYYGGWTAPNIYFLGFAGVIKFGNLRIGGLSGIYNARHYHSG